MMKRNDGFTLVELLCAIVAGSIVTAATSTILLLGLRINAHSNELTIRDNQVRICMSVLESFVKENPIDKELTANNKVYKRNLDGQQSTLLFCYDDGKLIINETNVVLLEGLDDAEINLSSDKNLIIVRLEIDDEEYTSSIRLRTGQIITIGS